MRKRPRPIRVVDNDFGVLAVTRLRRAVRITALTRTARHVGRPTTASSAFVDLDDNAIDRLIYRLQAIRGGRPEDRRDRRAIYCRNCGDPYDRHAENAALGVLSANWRPCPRPSPGKPMVDCGVGGHMYDATAPRSS